MCSLVKLQYMLAGVAAARECGVATYTAEQVIPSTAIMDGLTPPVVVGDASNLLVHFRLLTTNADKAFSALWGKLASEILMQNWEVAIDDVNNLRDAIEARAGAPALALMQQRCWLMHWALFILGNSPNGRQFVADLFFQERYLNAIQTNAPHLLRYLAVAVVTNPRRRGLLKELVRTIGLERHQHSDAVTLFLEDLYVRCDFEAEQARLADCAKLLDSDFFLSNQEEEFLKNAR